MLASFAKELWRVYPNSRLHVEMAEAGPDNTYSIIVQLLDADKKLIHSLKHTGKGDLYEVKHEAIQAMMRLALGASTA